MVISNYYIAWYGCQLTESLNTRQLQGFGKPYTQNEVDARFSMWLQYYERGRNEGISKVCCLAAIRKCMASRKERFS